MYTKSYKRFTLEELINAGENTEFTVDAVPVLTEKHTAFYIKRKINKQAGDSVSMTIKEK
jgi:hypothetical protein